MSQNSQWFVQTKLHKMVQILFSIFIFIFIFIYLSIIPSFQKITVFDELSWTQFLSNRSEILNISSMTSNKHINQAMY